MSGYTVTRRPRRPRLGLLVAATTSLVLGLASPAPLGGPAGAATPLDCLVPGMDDRCEKWAHKHADREYTVTGALNSAGTRAFSVGHRIRGTKYELQTIAYNVVTGEVLWVAREAGPTEQSHAMANAVALSSDEKTLYVVGKTYVETPPKQDALIVAYDAASGARLWSHVYDGPAGGIDDARAAVVSPLDDRLFVAVSAQVSKLPVRGEGVDSDFALLTFGGRSGGLLDEATYGGATFVVDGQTHGSADVPEEMAVSPDGSRVAVVGATAGRQTYRDNRAHVTVIVWERSSEGPAVWRRVWAREVPGAPIGLAMLTDGRVVFAGAFAEPTSSNRPYAVVGLDAAEGSTQWATRFELGGAYVEAPTALLVDQDRGVLYLPGLSRWPTDPYGTSGAVALNASDGTVKWTTRLRDYRSLTSFNYDADYFPAGAVDPASGHLQLTARREDRIITFSLDRRTGTTRWAGWYDYPAACFAADLAFTCPVREGPVTERPGPDWPIAIRAAAGRVVVFGSSFSPGTPLVTPSLDTRVLTIAYEV